MCALPQQVSDLTAVVVSPVAEQHQEQDSSPLVGVVLNEEQQFSSENEHSHDTVRDQRSQDVTFIETQLNAEYAVAASNQGCTADGRPSVPAHNNLLQHGWTIVSEAQSTPTLTPQDVGWKRSVDSDPTAVDNSLPRDIAIIQSQVSPAHATGTDFRPPSALLHANALLEEVLFDIRHGQLAGLYNDTPFRLSIPPDMDHEEDPGDEELRSLTASNPPGLQMEDSDDEDLRQGTSSSNSAAQMLLGCGPLVFSPSPVSTEWTSRPQSLSIVVQHAEIYTPTSGASSPSSAQSEERQNTLGRRLVVRNRNSDSSTNSSDSNGSSRSSSRVDSDDETVHRSPQSTMARSVEVETESEDYDEYVQRAHVRQITAVVQSRQQLSYREASYVRHTPHADTRDICTAEEDDDSGGETQLAAQSESALITEVDSEEARQFLQSPIKGDADIDCERATQATALSLLHSRSETRDVSKDRLASPSHATLVSMMDYESENDNDSVSSAYESSDDGGVDAVEETVLCISTDFVPYHHSNDRPASIALWTSSAERCTRRLTTTGTSSSPHLPPPLLRGLRRSACSTFWSPSVRISLQRRAESAPRVLVEESLGKTDEQHTEPREHEDNTKKQHITAPCKMTIGTPRCYTRPNFRVTIYPRMPDVFQDSRLHERIQSQLMASLSVNRRIQRRPERSHSLSSQRTRSLLGISPPTTEAPSRPLPDVPLSAMDAYVTTNAYTATYESSLSCSDEQQSCSCCSAASSLSVDTPTPQPLSQRQLPITVGTTTTTIKRTSWQRDANRDSWTSVTESETSYCSWVSYTSNSSVSSSSSAPAKVQRRCRDRHAGDVSRAVPLFATISPVLQASMLATEAAAAEAAAAAAERSTLTAQAASSPLVQDPFSPAPPSSCLMPLNLMAIDLCQVNTTLNGTMSIPEVPKLSPFYIDVYEYWPVTEDDEQHELALDKWARHQSARQDEEKRRVQESQALNSVVENGGEIATCNTKYEIPIDDRLFHDIDRPSGAQRYEQDGDDGDALEVESELASVACSSCGDDLQVSSSSSSSSSSDESARTLTPPRSEFHSIDSPGIGLHQVLSPLGFASHEEDFVKEQSPLMACLPLEDQSPFVLPVSSVAPLRINKEKPPQASHQEAKKNMTTQRRPAHRRWILVDANGKRIGEECNNPQRGSRTSTLSTSSKESRSTCTSSSSIDSSKRSSGSSLSRNSEEIGSEETRSEDYDVGDDEETRSSSSMTESTLRNSTDEELVDSQHKSLHDDVALPCRTSIPSTLLSRSECRDLWTDTSMAGASFDLFSNVPTAAIAKTPGRPSHPRSILKTASSRWSESSGVRSNSSTHTSTLTSRTNSGSVLSVHFSEPVLARKTSGPSAMPLRSATLSEQSSGSTTTAMHSCTSSSETLISSLDLDGEQQNTTHPQRRATIATAQPTRQDSSSAASSSRRLTSADLALRLQREELRRHRNDERLEALDKLEGKTRKSHLLANLIKSSNLTSSRSNASGAGGGGGGGVGAFGLGLDGMAVGGLDAERHAGYIGYDDDDEEEMMPTTPLTPTREALRQWEREWEIAHHVDQFTDNRAQRFTNVIGFDIGIVPFTQQQAAKQIRVKERKKATSAAATSATKRQSYLSNARSSQSSAASRFSRDIKTDSLASSGASSLYKGMENSVAIASPHAHDQQPIDKKLERELGAGLRKLSVAIEARHTARERFVDK